MTLLRLQVFVFLAERLNITKVAQALHVSQPAISRQLRLLQEEYNLTLFHRNGRGLELTADGKTFLKKVESIIAQVDRLKKNNSGEGSAERSKLLTIIGTDGPCTMFLPAIVAKFKKRHPEVQIDLHADTIARVENMIVKGDAEIGVTTSRPRSRRVACEPYMTQKLVFIVSVRHPMARKGSMTLADLATVPLLIHGAAGRVSTTEFLLNILSERGNKFNIALRCDTPDAIRNAVRARMGVGIMLAYPVSSQRELFSPAASGGAQRCRARRRSLAPSQLRCQAGSGTY